MSQVIPQRMTARIDGDFVVFLIGMRVNRPWKIWKMGTGRKPDAAHTDGACQAARAWAVVRANAFRPAGSGRLTG
ncbi:hypothetical protein [Afipia sp. GAS231]|uniref:hypothetical protein n=1 Tax=Afipia sp. GAS231 TaxID=1882747 RepID=UPI000AB459B1|nr:hypothetical protein [Afipia sp. GAS231]